MKKVVTFEQFAEQKAKQAQAQIEEEVSAKRDASANSFKNLLAEFGVASMDELSEEDKPKFNERLSALTESTDSVYKNGQKVMLIGQEGNEKTKWHGEVGTITKNGKSVKLDKTENTFQLGDKWRAVPVRESLVTEKEAKVGDQVKVIGKDGSEYKGTVKKLNPLKIKTGSSDTVLLPNALIKEIIVESVNEGRKMSKKDVITSFENEILPDIKKREGKNPDVPMRREAFNNYIDALHKDGEISDKLVDTLALPDRLEESAITEAEIKSDDEFKEYAFTVLQKAFGEDFDEAKAQEVVDGILGKVDGDYGKATGILQSSLGESVMVEKADYKYKKDSKYPVEATVCYLDPMTRQRKCNKIYFKSKFDALGFKDNVKGFPKGAKVEAINESNYIG